MKKAGTSVKTVILAQLKYFELTLLLLLYCNCCYFDYLIIIEEC